MNIQHIQTVYEALEELANEVVFVGGATVSLYTDRPAEDIRPTYDIDILVELTTYKQYSGLEEKLRTKGFVNDTESDVICRYKIHGVVVDVMPTEETILGFTNRWYPDGFKNTIGYPIGTDHQIQLFAPPYFLASKIEAFKSRGNGDGRWSTDFEDIVYFLNNRTTIWAEMESCDEKVKRYLTEELSGLLQHKYIHEWISAHLEFSDRQRVSFLIGAINNFLEKHN